MVILGLEPESDSKPMPLTMVLSWLPAPSSISHRAGGAEKESACPMGKMHHFGAMPPLRGSQWDLLGQLGSQGPEGVQPTLLFLQLTSTGDCSTQKLSNLRDV